MTRDPYERRLIDRIERICPGAYEGLSDIASMPEETAEAVLRELLESGCLSQNAANIELARKAVRRLPREFVTAHLPKAVPLCLFQEREWQEWEFRRAAELLEEAFPEALAWLAEYGKGLKNPEVDEAIADLQGRDVP